MADDIYVYTPPPDPFDGIPPPPPPVDEPRTFGGLGKARAAIRRATRRSDADFSRLQCSWVSA